MNAGIDPELLSAVSGWKQEDEERDQPSQQPLKDNDDNGDEDELRWNAPAQPAAKPSAPLGKKPVQIELDDDPVPAFSSSPDATDAGQDGSVSVDNDDSDQVSMPEPTPPVVKRKTAKHQKGKHIKGVKAAKRGRVAASAPSKLVSIPVDQLQNRRR